jgi:hypothetical protein
LWKTVATVVPPACKQSVIWQSYIHWLLYDTEIRCEDNCVTGYGVIMAERFSAYIECKVVAVYFILLWHKCVYFIIIKKHFVCSLLLLSVISGTGAVICTAVTVAWCNGRW